MKIDKATRDRWEKYARLYVHERGYRLEDIHDTGQVWHVAHMLDIPREARHIDPTIKDKHIETVLRTIFPNMNKRA